MDLGSIANIFGISGAKVGWYLHGVILLFNVAYVSVIFWGDSTIDRNEVVAETRTGGLVTNGMLSSWRAVGYNEFTAVIGLVLLAYSAVRRRDADKEANRFFPYYSSRYIDLAVISWLAFVFCLAAGTSIAAFLGQGEICTRGQEICKSLRPRTKGFMTACATLAFFETFLWFILASDATHTFFQRNKDRRRIRAAPVAETRNIA